MDKNAPIFVAGHRGMIGSAVLRALQAQNYKNILVRDKTQLDLTHAPAVTAFFQTERPTYVVLAAGRTGGILKNSQHPAELLTVNLAIGLNVLQAAHAHGVRKTVFLGSSCIYPKNASQPMHEDILLTGRPEETSLGTALAKLAGLQLCHAYNQEAGEARFIALIPNNAYGPGDDFSPATGHVLSSLIHRFHEAATTGAEEIELWGTGTPRREFIHVDDIASACLLALHIDVKAASLPLNVGPGEDISIHDLARLIAGMTGFKGKILFNSDKPDGAPRKLLDSSRMRALGWQPRIALEQGIKGTYQWYLAQKEDCTSNVKRQAAGH